MKIDRLFRLVPSILDVLRSLPVYWVLPSFSSLENRIFIIATCAAESKWFRFSFRSKNLIEKKIIDRNGPELRPMIKSRNWSFRRLFDFNFLFSFFFADRGRPNVVVFFL